MDWNNDEKWKIVKATMEKETEEWHKKWLCQPCYHELQVKV